MTVNPSVAVDQLTNFAAFLPLRAHVLLGNPLLAIGVGDVILVTARPPTIYRPRLPFTPDVPDQIAIGWTLGGVIDFEKATL